MTCWVSRLELFAIHHRACCCKLVTSMHPTCPLVVIHAMWWSALSVLQFLPEYHRISMQERFAWPSELYMTFTHNECHGQSVSHANLFCIESLWYLASIVGPSKWTSNCPIESNWIGIQSFLLVYGTGCPTLKSTNYCWYWVIRYHC